IGDIPGSGRNRRALQKEPDHAGAVPVPGYEPSYCFHHSTNEHGRHRHGCSHIPHQHGAFHRPIGGVFCVHDPTRTRSRSRQTRSGLRTTTAGERVKPKVAAIVIDAASLESGPTARVQSPCIRNRSRIYSFSTTHFPEFNGTIFSLSPKCFSEKVLPAPRNLRNIAG